MFDSATSTASTLTGAAFVSAKPPTIGAFVPPSSFVGREQESTAVKRLLAQTRLLTLTGPGGVGKTRLAFEVARDMGAGEMFAGGAWFTGLAPLADAALVPQAIAAALGVREQAGRHILETIGDAMRHRRLLLVLDNCEHLVEACAQGADTLLRGCPGLTILATSREPLKIAGETAWPVPPLRVPARFETRNLDDLLACEAIQLFVQRAQSAAPAFALTDVNAGAVAEICTRLDGIPLAIELAAARVRLLAPDQIAARLADRFRLLTGGSRTALPRHQTIRALVDWSYELLPEQERTLFSRLGVFAGDWSLEAAEAVVGGDGIEPSAVMDLVGNLVDKSLVVAQPTAPGNGQVRYRLLETLREYALERLSTESNVAPTVRRHAHYFLELAEGADNRYWAGDEARALSSIESDHDNFRAAMRHFVASGEGECAARLAGGLSMFWFIRGYCSEGRTWLREVLAQVAPDGPSGSASAVYAKVLQADARLAQVECDHVSAEQRLRQRSRSGVGWATMYSLPMPSSCSLASSWCEASARPRCRFSRRALVTRNGPAIARWKSWCGSGWRKLRWRTGTTTRRVSRPNGYLAAETPPDRAETHASHCSCLAMSRRARAMPGAPARSSKRASSRDVRSGVGSSRGRR
jgi:predicted ATPase